MRSLALATAGILLSTVSVAADQKSNLRSEPASTPYQPKPPLSLIEKNKLAAKGKSLQPGLETRVVGGDQVLSTSKYPFFCEWESSKCGGSLIHEDIMLSAAHCESLEHPFSTRVFVNGITSEGGIFRNVERQVSHPLWKSSDNNDYDYMILKLESSALQDSQGNPTTASTVTLNLDATVPATGDKLMAVGYGLTEEGGTSTSPTLQDVEVNYVDDSVCMQQYGSETYVPDLMFCAGVPGGGKDTCQGDSGGPIMDQNTGTQVGVVSFGIGCARATHNGVYARVSTATNWIQQQVCELSDNPPAGCPPKSGNGGGPRNGEITLHVTYDNYASETGIKLVNFDTDEVLFFQYYQQLDETSNGQTVSHSFTDLPRGTYLLLLGDAGRDGNCCGYGDGKFWLTDDKFGGTFYENDGDYDEFIQAEFTIDASGRATFIEENDDFLNSWEKSVDPPNYPQQVDQTWPGPKPATTNSLDVNVKFDRFPNELSWELSLLEQQADGTLIWTLVESFNGATAGIHNDLVSTRLDNLLEGWYKFELKDAGGDGNCCSFRRGWATLTSYILATRRSGMAWGTNGEFGSGTIVYFYMNADGMVARITDMEPTSVTA